MLNFIVAHLQKTVKSQTFSNFCLQQWCDYRLRWDQPPRSALYGNITSELRIPSKSIWLPDVILENKWVYQPSLRSMI